MDDLTADLRALRVGRLIEELATEKASLNLHWDEEGWAVERWTPGQIPNYGYGPVLYDALVACRAAAQKGVRP